MKRAVLIISLFFFFTAIAGSDSLVYDFFNNKMQLLSEDLETHDFRRLLHYFDPGHLQMNIYLLPDGEFDFSDGIIDFVLMNWGFFTAGQGTDRRINSIHDITGVESFHILEEEVFFELKLMDGSKATISAMIDWETLLLSGAAG